MLFYSYNAESLEDDPVKSWIGREVKRFLAEAHIHLPFLLQLASAPIDVVDCVAEDEGAGLEYESDDEYAPTSDEVAEEEKAEPLMIEHAQAWDNFLEWVRLIQTPWASDSDEYRKSRAVSWFNCARRCSRDLYTLKPTMFFVDVGAAHSILHCSAADSAHGKPVESVS